MEKKNIGISIIITDKIGADGGFIRAFDSKGSATCVEDAILECLREKYTIEVMAFGTQNAIERILYMAGALMPYHRDFFLTQISLSLVEVKNGWGDISYGADEIVKQLIVEDKMYRIFSHEQKLKEEKK